MSVVYIETNAHLRKDLEHTWYTDDEGKVEVWEDYIMNYEYLTLVAPYKSKVCIKGQTDLIKLGNIHELEHNKKYKILKM